MSKLFIKGFKEYYNNGTLYNEEEVMLAAREYIFCNHEFTEGPLNFDNFNCESFDKDNEAASLIGESIFSICSKHPMFIYQFQAMLFRCLSKDFETFITEMNYIFPEKVESIRSFIGSCFIDSRKNGFIIPIEECNCILSLYFGIIDVNNYALMNRVYNLLHGIGKELYYFIMEETSESETQKKIQCLYDFCTHYGRELMYNAYPELNIEDFVSKECMESLQKYEDPMLHYKAPNRISVHLREFPFEE